MQLAHCLQTRHIMWAYISLPATVRQIMVACLAALRCPCSLRTACRQGSTVLAVDTAYISLPATVRQLLVACRQQIRNSWPSSSTSAHACSCLQMNESSSLKAVVDHRTQAKLACAMQIT